MTDPVPERGPIESKVWASLIGAGSGTVVSSSVLWAIGAGFFTGDWSAEGAKAAVLAVPEPLSGIIMLVLTAGLTFVGGYFARHTPRNDAQALADANPPVYTNGDGQLGLPEGVPGRARVSRSIHDEDEGDDRPTVQIERVDRDHSVAYGGPLLTYT